MSYVMVICRAGATIEIDKRHCRRYPPPGGRREKKENPTTEAQEQVNIRNAEKWVRRYMNHNFLPGDLYITLDYAKDKRPETGKVMRDHADHFKRRLRRLYSKKGMQLKYMYVMERGSKGALHHHILIQDGATVQEIRELWPYGRVHIDPLDNSGQYRRLASYFIKYSVKTRKTDASLMSRYCEMSRNLIKPEEKKVIVNRKHWRKEASIKKGYYLDKDTEQHYIDRNGYEAMRYVLVKIPEEKEEEKCRRIYT